ncbi:hypothetical protein [Actinomyces oris]|nr:hypothetical protein [Actinomyces oris]
MSVRPHTSHPARRTSGDWQSTLPNHHGPAIGRNKRPRISGAGPPQ